MTSLEIVNSPTTQPENNPETQLTNQIQALTLTSPEKKQDAQLINQMHTLTLTPPEKKPYMVLSWNVDCYTNDIHLWLSGLIQGSQPDVIFLSETKKKEEDLAPLLGSFTDYNVIINAHDPAKWHGVAMLIRKDHSYQELPVQMNIPTRSDSKGSEAAKGRIIIICLNKELFIVGSYTPNSGRSDKVKLDYRTKTWDPTFFNLLELLRASGPTMWVGDINVALDDIDVSNPKTMCKYAGFTPEERANFRSLLNTGNWIDVWRHQHPTERKYTWCGSPPRPDYGLRLDNIVVSKSLLPNMMNCFTISDGVPLSADHIMVGAYVKRKS